MTVNAHEIAQKMVAALRADTTFTNFCNSALGTVPAFFIGFDADNPPVGVKLPFVAIVPVSEQDNDNYLEHQLNIGAAISDGTITTNSSTNTVDFSGYGKVSRVGRELLAGVKRFVATEEQTPISASTTISMLAWTAARITHAHPEYHVTRELTITTQN
jgi:hypothetical protein